MKKKPLIVLACTLALLVLFGCAAQSDDGPDYADDEAMDIIAKGWEKRIQKSKRLFGESDEFTMDDAEYVAKLKEVVQTEIDNDAPLKERQFEDTKMQEDVLAYINALDESMTVLNTYAYGEEEYFTNWDKAYDQRTILLKKFHDDYSLTVSQTYQDDFDELLKNGNAAKNESDQKEAIDNLIANATWEPIDDGYGYVTYTAVVENTSDYDFKDISLNIGLYDSDDVRSESYAGAQSWKKGEKVKFEVYTGDSDVQRIEATVNYFDTVE